MKTLLIDGDILLFTICRITEDISDFGDETFESFSEEATIQLLDQGIKDIGIKCGYEWEEMVFCITDEHNFRKDLFPTYKSNRKNVRKPLGLKFIRQHLLDEQLKYQTALMGGLEADDIMGIYGSGDPEHMSIYSQDKDLFTIPCRQWDFKKHKFITPTPFESATFLYTQTLTGDVVDGYSGIKGIGKVKANKILLGAKNEMDLLQAVHRAYYTHFEAKAKEMFLAQMGQARILHNEDYIRLATDKTTYNPYEALGVTDEQVKGWEDL